MGQIINFSDYAATRDKEPPVSKQAIEEALSVQEIIYTTAVKYMKLYGTQSLCEMRLFPYTGYADTYLPPDTVLRRWAFSYDGVEEIPDGYDKDESAVRWLSDTTYVTHGIVLCDGVCGLLQQERGYEAAQEWLDILHVITRYAVVFNTSEATIRDPRFDFFMRSKFTTVTVEDDRALCHRPGSRRAYRVIAERPIA